mmetsp:Transcript_8433/g.18106  ORF Transcript_8433/g.18106 Transcript_8433/m.18106 type:complete len:488 (+) Transcript_8433:131-1594(+)
MDELRLEIEMLRLVQSTTDYIGCGCSDPGDRQDGIVNGSLCWNRDASETSACGGGGRGVDVGRMQLGGVDWGERISVRKVACAASNSENGVCAEQQEGYGHGARGSEDSLWASGAFSDVSRSQNASFDVQDGHSTSSAASVSSVSSTSSTNGSECVNDLNGTTPSRSARSTKQTSSKSGFSYPVRPGAPPCQYYLKTGKCSYGARCKFNHPPRDEKLLSALHRRDCFDFVHTGECPYGSTCKYNHPAERLTSSAFVDSSPHCEPSPRISNTSEQAGELGSASKSTVSTVPPVTQRRTSTSTGMADLQGSPRFKRSSLQQEALFPSAPFETVAGSVLQPAADERQSEAIERRLSSAEWKEFEEFQRFRELQRHFKQSAALPGPNAHTNDGLNECPKAIDGDKFKLETSSSKRSTRAEDHVERERGSLFVDFVPSSAPLSGVHAGARRDELGIHSWPSLFSQDALRHSCAKPRANYHLFGADPQAWGSQ